MKIKWHIVALFAILIAPGSAVTVIGGHLISGATGLDAEISTFSATGTPSAFTNTSNAAVEIGSTGIYYVSLTAAEMNAPYIILQIKSNEAKTAVLLINTAALPIDLGDTSGTGAVIGTYGGTGDNTVTVTLQTAGAVPIPSAQVTVKNTGQTVTYAKLMTGVTGKAVFALDNGTYHLICSDYGNHTFTVPEVLTVSGSTAMTVTGTAFDPGTPTSPSVCRVYGWLYNSDGSGKSVQTIKASLRAADYPAAYDSNDDGTPDQGIGFAKTGGSTTTNAAGYWYLDLTYSARVLHVPGNTATKYSFTGLEAGVTHDASVPSTTTAKWDTLTWTKR